MKLKLFPYKMGSRSAKVLSQELSCVRVYPDRNYHHYSNHLVINWGNSTPPNWYDAEKSLLNKYDSVKIASNKLTTLQVLGEAGVSIPDWTTDKHLAFEWFNDGKVIVARSTLTGHSGQGIKVFVPELDNWDNEYYPLYTKHVRHKREFRVHVFKGRVLDFTEKKRRESFNGDLFVRNHINGWVFCREGVELPEDVSIQAIKAVQALGLDFGAVDVGYKQSENKAYVFEVNTAPGLEGTTLAKYREAFQNVQSR